MSSVHPPNRSMQMLPCQRCNTPLPSNEPRCKNCGYDNASVQGNNPAQGMQPSSNMSRNSPMPQAAYRQGQPPTAFAPQQQFGASSTGQQGQPPVRVPLAGPNGQAPLSPS